MPKGERYPPTLWLPRLYRGGMAPTVLVVEPKGYEDIPYDRRTPERAAATQMLEVLKVIEDQVAAGECPDYDAIREAIAAAEGGANAEG